MRLSAMLSGKTFLARLLLTCSAEIKQIENWYEKFVNQNFSLSLSLSLLRIPRVVATAKTQEMI